VSVSAVVDVSAHAKLIVSSTLGATTPSSSATSSSVSATSTPSPSPTSSPSPPSSGSLSTSGHTNVAAIAGGVGGGVGGLALLALGFFFFYRRRRHAHIIVIRDSEEIVSPYFSQPSGAAESFVKVAGLSAPPTPSPVHPLSVAPSRTEPDLDRIVEGLAERFGWRAPPTTDSADGDGPLDPLPAYDGWR